MDTLNDKEKLKSLKNDFDHMKQLYDDQFRANVKSAMQISTLKKTLSELTKKHFKMKKEFEKKIQQFDKNEKEFKKRINQFELLFSLGEDDLTSSDVHVPATPVTPEKPPVKRKRTPDNNKSKHRVSRSSNKKKKQNMLC